MKKSLFPLILLSGLTLTADACSAGDVPENAGSPARQPDNGRYAVVYFSCTNTTRGVADRIAALTGGKTHRIAPETPYTKADLDYNRDCRANREQNDPSARPAIQGKGENLADCDVVFLGYPIWWGKAPKAVYTFLESHDLAGKTIVPFCTSGSSGVGSSDTELHGLAPRAQWKRGRRFSGNEANGTIEDWLESLDPSLNPAGSVGPNGSK